METDTTPKAQIIQLNEGAIRDHLGEMVRSTVEDTLNRMLDAEANQLCNAEKYQRNEARTDTRAGHYQRRQAKGQVWTWTKAEWMVDDPKLAREVALHVHRYSGEKLRSIGAHLGFGDSAVVKASTRLEATLN